MSKYYFMHTRGLIVQLLFFSVMLLFKIMYFILFLLFC